MVLFPHPVLLDISQFGIEITLKEQNNEINISRLSTGVYQVVVTGIDGVIHLKLAVE